MTPQNFEIYRKLLKEKSGLIITPDKGYLLESRLNPIAKKMGLADLDALAAQLLKPNSTALITEVIEAMTTNETSFFRDQRPFDLFKDYVLPEMTKLRSGQKSIKIWCAAASSGQEPYSLSMIMKDRQKAAMAGWNCSILGTDISIDILNQAKEGLYSQFEVQRGLPIQMLMSYFTQEGDRWRISNEIKSMVKYEMFNLLNSMTNLGKFDIIFCRNVLIYFDEATKRDILDRMSKQLAPDGFLFLGGAETVIGITQSFVPVPDRRGVYVPQGSPHLKAVAAE